MSKSKMIASSYVYHNDVGFQVSTMDRESSAPMAGRYSETIVWDMGRNSMLYMDTAPSESIQTHIMVLERIYHEGCYWEGEDE